MKTMLIFVYLIVLSIGIYGQKQDNTELIGKISFISAQYYYVAFDNTSGIQKGDTLYVNRNGILLKSLIVEHLSGRSCAGKVLNNIKLSLDELIIAYVSTSKQKESGNNISVKATIEEVQDVVTEKIIKERIIQDKPNFKGKIAITSYSNFDNFSSAKFSQRWRYQLSTNVENINNSALSLESYFVFSYRNKDWLAVKNNLGNAIKVYDLNLKYNLNDNNILWFGRKINNKISNIGTVDGVQYEIKLNMYFLGAVVGSRPNLSDFGYNLKMFQFGIYAGRTDTINSGVMTNTFSFFNQTNNFKTDRRFIYLQHSNNIIENINMFYSSELDLYRRKNKIEESKIFLTSFYSSLSFSPSKWFSVNTSYDARKNVIYYETFKSFADSLLESETRQGVRLRTNFRINNLTSISFNFGYRFKSGDNKASNNYGGSITYNQLPFFEGLSTLSYNKISSSYLDGNIYNLNLYKDLFAEIVSTGIGYRFVSYKFLNNSTKITQNIFTLDFSFSLMKKLYLSCNYEGVFEKQRTYGSIYINLNKRF